MRIKLIALVAIAVLASAAYWLFAGSSSPSSGAGQSIELLNVSYDPTRELWRDINSQFIPSYAQQSGHQLEIRQSHGGSGAPARAVIDGLDADVVTLALWHDTDAIRRRGLINEGWESRFPNRSLPYASTIVFVVRKGNPKQIKDWPDLIKEGVEIVTPNPKTSGNGKLSFLGAWGAVTLRGGSEQDARDFVTKLYRQTPVLDTGAQGATTTFAQKKIGDVHLTWENEAKLEVKESGGALELVYPPISVLAEPHVAVVDANVKRKGPAATAAAEAYLNFLYTDAAQEIIAKHFYRPSNEAVLAKHSGDFPKLELFPITKVAKDWDEVQAKFFADGAVFDAIYQKSSK